MKKDINIMFCPKCKWKLVNGEDYEKIGQCPKCKSWLYKISQNYYYEGRKEIGREFMLTDRDEMSFISYDFKEAKKLIDKAFKLFAKAKQEVKK